MKRHLVFRILCLDSIILACLSLAATGSAKPAMEKENKPEKAAHAPSKADSSAQTLPLRGGPERVRPPRVAGQFYKGSASALKAEVERLMKSGPSIGLRETRAVIAPHAGYVFSGRTAAAAYREVEPGFRRVFLLAGNHNGNAVYSGVSIPQATRYAIPGAEVPLSAVADELLKEDASLFKTVPAAHAAHVIEVHLPFLQQLKGWPEKPDYAIIPMVLGRMGERNTRRLAEVLCRYVDPQTLFVVSTDLSHFKTDAEARQTDRQTIGHIMSREWEKLSLHSCCSLEAVRALLLMSEKQGWEPTFAEYTNSSGASGDKSRVVGYAAIPFTEPLKLTREEKEELLSYAKRVVEARVRGGKSPQAGEDWLEHFPIFRIPRGVFVTIEKNGQLRGCIGHLKPEAPLHAGVRECAVSAALRDQRFPPVKPEELDDLTYTISILDHPKPLRVPPPEFPQALQPGAHGVILKCGGRQSTFLPEVWKQLPDPEEFLSHLARKQGSPASAWKNKDTVLHTYRACVLHEE